jgi:integrase
MAMPRHIEQRRLGWYAVLNVPADVQKKVGKKRFRMSLKTRDKKVAERLAKPLVADWEQQITMARDEKAAKSETAYWRNTLLRATTEEERASIILLISGEAYDIGTENVDPGQSPSSDPEAQRFFSEAVGARVPTAEYIDEWIASLQVKEKTAAMRRSTVMRLGQKFPILQDISRKDVRRWMTELMADLKPATVQRIMSDCRIYWAYLGTIEVVPEDSAPFDRLGLKVKNTARLPWSSEDLVKLHHAAEFKDQVLADLILLAMYSGARLGELVDLRVTDVDDDRFRITSSKTAAGIREVPIHREVQQTMARLIEESKDGYVLSGITAKRRAATMSKAFQRLRKAAGYTDERQVFHSIRNAVITMLEHAGVPEGTVQDIVGHERSTLTGSTYSGKSTFDMRRDALEKLAY